MREQLIRNFVIFSTIVVISVCMITIVVLRGNEKIDQSKEQIISSHDLVTLTKSLGIEIENILANQRGYFLTSDTNFLNDYNTSKTALDEYLSTLDIVTEEPLKPQLETLKSLVQSYIERLDQTLVEYNPRNRNTSLDDYQTINQLSDEISNLTGEFVEREYATLNNRITYFQSKQKKYQETLVAVAFITGTLLIIFNIWLLRAQLNLLNAKQDAEKATKAKGDFLAHMSHEIRTPLTAISGAAEILAKKRHDYDERTSKLLGVINSSSASLKDLITDILDFSKIEGNQIDLDYAYHNLGSILQQVISIMSVRAAEKGLDFSIINNLPEDTKFYCDKTRLRQILINLVGNAIKFTDKGFVKIALKKVDYFDPEERQSKSFLEFAVIDQGVGIAADKLDVIFQEFKQADSSVSRRFGGTGLGLSISRHLAVLMGGKLTVESTLNEGSTFTLTLPAKLKIAEKETAPKKAKKKINVKQCNNKLLIVEDYEGNVAVISSLLDDYGHKYDVAHTGVEAIEAFEKNKYELILMDIQMPEMDGLTATRTIRALEQENKLSPTPVLGMTAHALVEDKQKCIEAGMNDFIPKPIDEERFIKTLNKYIADKKEAA